MKTVLSVDLGEIFGGSDFDIPMNLSAAEFSIDQAGNIKYTDLALQVSIPLLGNMSLKGDGYTDAAEETEKKPDGETEKKDPVFSLDPQKVSGIYINKNNGSYIVDIGPEIVNDLQDQAEITGTENAKCFVTFDKGLALTGLWLGADAIHVKTEAEEVKAAAADQDADDETPMDMIEGLL